MITMSKLTNTLCSLTSAGPTIQGLLDEFGIDIGDGSQLDNIALRIMLGMPGDTEDWPKLDRIMLMVQAALVHGVAAGIKLERAAQLEELAA